MVHLFGSRRNLATFDKLLSVQSRLPPLRVHSYQSAFQRERVPTGSLILTDFDMLHVYEVDMLTAMVRAARRHDPDVRILNEPGRVLERTPLLHALHAAGRSPIEVTRLDMGEVPSRYPVFIRTEDGCGGPETGLLEDEVAFLQQRDRLRAAGLSLKRRIAVTFAAQRDDAGLYRKYGAFIVGRHVIPQHILRSPHWNVKSRVQTDDPAFDAEAQQYFMDNPDRQALLDIAEIAGVSYGRVDFTRIDDRPVVFEINTNPTFPGFRKGSRPDRVGRRSLILDRLAEAMAEIDGGTARRRSVSFQPPANANHAFVERDAWYRHPLQAATRARSWHWLGRRIGVLDKRKDHDPRDTWLAKELP